MSFFAPSTPTTITAPPPPPAPLPAPPTPASQAVQATGNMVQQRAQAAAGQGFSGTLLSGSQGASKPNTAKQTLGG